MALQPWRIYDPSFRYHHSVYEGLNAHVLARDDGRDQRPGRGPPARPAGCFALIMHEMAHLRFHDSLSLFVPLLSRSYRSIDPTCIIVSPCMAESREPASLASTPNLSQHYATPFIAFQIAHWLMASCPLVRSHIRSRSRSLSLLHLLALR